MITDEMVEAALKAEEEYHARNDMSYTSEGMRRALSAALAAMPQEPVAWTRDDMAKGLAALDGIVLLDIRSTVGPAQDANSWREYLGRADDLMAHLSLASPAQGATARDIGIVGPVDGMNNPSAQGPYFRIVLMTGDNQNRSEYLISKGAAEDLRDTLNALLVRP